MRRRAPSAGPMVRIRLPPAGSPLRTRFGRSHDKAVLKNHQEPLSARRERTKGRPSQSKNDVIALMAIVGTSASERITVNEMTTIASGWTAACPKSRRAGAA